MLLKSNTSHLVHKLNSMEKGYINSINMHGSVICVCSPFTQVETLDSMENAL